MYSILVKGKADVAGTEKFKEISFNAFCVEFGKDVVCKAKGYTADKLLNYINEGQFLLIVADVSFQQEFVSKDYIINDFDILEVLAGMVSADSSLSKHFNFQKDGWHIPIELPIEKCVFTITHFEVAGLDFDPSTLAIKVNDLGSVDINAKKEQENAFVIDPNTGEFKGNFKSNDKVEQEFNKVFGATTKPKRRKPIKR